MKDEQLEDEQLETTASALEEAWDASENGDAEETQAQDTESQSEAAASSDEGGESSSDGGKDKPALNEKWVRRGEEEEGTVGGSAEENQNPPVGLSPAAREEWKNVPESVRADIVKRESDYANGIEKHRANSERAQSMDQAMAPYSQFIQMNGGPGQAVTSLLQIGSVLQMGTPQQKAQAAASIVKDYGIDVRQLDGALVGESPPPESLQQDAVQQQVAQQMAPFNQFMQQQQQHQQFQQQQQQDVVNQEVGNFGSSNEFYNDVKMDMADYLDMAANRGRAMSMDQAYKLACANHPQIASIIAGRATQESVDQKRQAAASISGTPGGTMQSGSPGSTLSALNQAWDEAGQM